MAGVKIKVNNKYMDFESINKSKPRNEDKSEKEISEEEVLNSNDVELIARYAKENRSQAAIDKVRELLEFSRATGEGVIQNFCDSFKECQEEKKDYSDFENTPSGKLALELLEKMPEPFKSQAYGKLENYKESLRRNTELHEKTGSNPEKIWKETFGFDYYDVPDLKERLRNFFLENIRGINKSYYKKNTLEVRPDPFAINFFIGDLDNFNQAYSQSTENIGDTCSGFSKIQNGAIVNVVNTSRQSPDRAFNEEADDVVRHETEHAIHRHANPFPPVLLEPDVLENYDFENISHRLNYAIKFDYEERLKIAKDEIFAYLKGGAPKEDTKFLLIDKDVDAGYDYNRRTRDLNAESISRNEYCSESEKQKLKEALDFMQSEYDKVLKNMIDVIYSENKTVEFFRNVPINELWKYSDGKYSRTDFLIRKFKF